MRVLLRADAGVVQGTGHVMRCMTLAEELLARGHHVDLMTAPIGVEWLARVVRESGVGVIEVGQDRVPREEIDSRHPDWVVVDSYRIPAAELSSLAETIPLLAVVDGDDRGIDATLYLDQNLGAESLARRPFVADRLLAGASFALVRGDVLRARREQPWHFRSHEPRLLAFMGGTDPTGSIIPLAQVLAAFNGSLETTIVAPGRFHEALRGIIDADILLPTPDLPRYLGEADLVVSAAGTSAWDVCALGLPALFVAVVDNQVRSLAEAVARGVALGLDAVDEGADAFARAAGPLSQLVGDESLRERLSRAATTEFDGLGARRVVDRLEVGPGPLF